MKGLHLLLWDTGPQLLLWDANTKVVVMGCGREQEHMVCELFEIPFHMFIVHIRQYCPPSPFPHDVDRFLRSDKASC
jgi:hypothetical protein